MRLYLVQHGDALPEGVDPERPLSGKGKADVGRLARWLGESGVTVPRILHSGKLRAAQSAELFAPLLAGGGGLQVTEGVAPNDSPQAFLDRVGDGNLIVASHMPFVSRTVSVALGLPPDRPVVAFEPGSMAVLELVDDGWQLVAFVRPEHV